MKSHTSISLLGMGLIVLATPISAVPNATDVERIEIAGKLPVKPLQQVPVSVSVLDAEALSQWQINHNDELAFALPNLGNRNNSSINTGFQIRGVGSDNWHVNANQSIAIAMDEANYASPFVATLSLYDVTRVEVHRGPQSALYGINSTGGAVNYTSQKPIFDEYSGLVKWQMGKFNTQQLTGSINIGVSDTIATRFAWQGTSSAGPWLNLYNNRRTGGKDIQSWRWHLAWEPSDNNAVLLTVENNRNDTSRVQYLGAGYWDSQGSNVVEGQIVDTSLPSDCPIDLLVSERAFIQSGRCVSLLPFSGGQATAGGASSWFKSYDASEDISDVAFSRYKMVYRYQGERWRLDSISIRDMLLVEHLQSLSNIPEGLGFMPGQISDTERWAQEFRLAWELGSTWDAMLGTFWENESAWLGTVISRTDNDGAPFGIMPSVVIEQDKHIRSIFGLIEFQQDNWLVNVTARLTNEQRKGVSTARVMAKTDNAAPNGTPFDFGQFIDRASLTELALFRAGVCPPPVGGLPCALSVDVTQENDFTAYNFQVGYKLNAQTRIFGGLSRGFISGAFDTRALAAFVGTADQPVLPETLDAIEVGVKYQTQALFISSAVFVYDWQDKQTFDVNELGQPAFVNVPKSRLQGVEAEIKWHITPRISTNIGLGWLSSEITQTGVLAGVTKGDELSHTPSYQHSASVSYTQPFSWGDAVFGINGSFVGDRFSTLNNDPRSLLRSQSILNLQYQQTFSKYPNWSVSAGIKNLTGARYCLTKIANATLNYNYQCLPNLGTSQWYASVRYTW